MRSTHQSKQSPASRQTTRGMRGFTLVELMVALTIALLIIAAVGRIFFSSRSTYQVDEGLARLQENARFALDALQREIRMAGLYGCIRDPSKIQNNLNSDTTFPYNLKVAIQGYEASGTGPNTTVNLSASDFTASTTMTDWTPSLDGVFSGKILPKSDIVVVRHVSPTSVPISTGTAGAYFTATSVYMANLPAAADFAVKDIAVVSDCSAASVFQIDSRASGSTSGVNWVRLTHDNSAAASPGNRCPNWGTGANCDNRSYSGGAEIGKAMTTAFYVGPSASGKGPALFRLVLRAGQLSEEEIVEGVENIQILYGIDNATPMTGYAQQYVTAASLATATDWAKVVSVRIGVLMRTTGSVETTTDTGNYLLGAGVAAAGTTINPVDDKRRRRIFTTTIQLRNRLPST